MRTTVDLPLPTLERVKAIAAEREASVSATVADLTARGLAQLGTPVTLTTDPQTGFPLLTVGRSLSDADTVELIDE